MPMIRKPNFADVSYDVDINKYKVPVDGKIISLKEYIKNIGTYTGNNNIGKLLLDRDEKILTQVQSCILPCKEKENTEFCVNIYNYQSRKDNPCVLTILVSKNGTSTSIIENNTDLYFNNNGDSHYFKVERLGDVRFNNGSASTNKAVEYYKEMTGNENLENCLMIFQIPLVNKQPNKRMFTLGCNSSDDFNDSNFFSDPNNCVLESNCTNKPNITRTIYFSGAKSKSCGSTINKSNSLNKYTDNTLGMDMGNISLGSKVGTYKGTNNLTLERDIKYPIRCTYQYYRVSDTDNINNEVVKDIIKQLDAIKNLASSEGSLVVEDSERITESSHSKDEPTKYHSYNWGNTSMLK